MIKPKKSELISTIDTIVSEKYPYRLWLPEFQFTYNNYVINVHKNVIGCLEFNDGLLMDGFVLEHSEFTYNSKSFEDLLKEIK